MIWNSLELILEGAGIKSRANGSECIYPWRNDTVISSWAKPILTTWIGFLLGSWRKNESFFGEGRVPDTFFLKKGSLTTWDWDSFGFLKKIWKFTNKEKNRMGVTTTTPKEGLGTKKWPKSKMPTTNKPNKING